MNTVRIVASLIGFLIITLNNYFGYFDMNRPLAILIFLGTIIIYSIYVTAINLFKPGILDKIIPLEKYLIYYTCGSFIIFLLYMAMFWVLPVALEILINILIEIKNFLTSIANIFN